MEHFAKELVSVEFWFQDPRFNSRHFSLATSWANVSRRVKERMVWIGSKMSSQSKVPEERVESESALFYPICTLFARFISFHNDAVWWCLPFIRVASREWTLFSIDLRHSVYINTYMRMQYIIMLSDPLDHLTSWLLWRHYHQRGWSSTASLRQAKKVVLSSSRTRGASSGSIWSLNFQ